MKSITNLLFLIILITPFLSCEKEQIYDKLLLSKVYHNGELRQVYYYNEKDLIDYVETYFDGKIDNKSVYFYNIANKVSKIFFLHYGIGVGTEVNFYYNQENQLIETDDEGSSIHKYAYDETGRLVADTLFIGNTERINYYRTFEPVNSRSYKTNYYSYNGKLSGDIIYEFDRDIDPKSYSTKMKEPVNCIKMSSSNEIDGNAIFEFEIEGYISQNGESGDCWIVPLSSSSYSYNMSGYPTKKYTIFNSDPSKTLIISYEYIVP